MLKNDNLKALFFEGAGWEGAELSNFIIDFNLNRTNFEQKHTMGMFISTAPLRINLEHEKSFIDFSKTIARRKREYLSE